MKGRGGVMSVSCPKILPDTAAFRQRQRMIFGMSSAHCTSCLPSGVYGRARVPSESYTFRVRNGLSANSKATYNGRVRSRSSLRGEPCLTRGRVLETLNQVREPEVGLSIVGLNLVDEVIVANGQVKVRFHLTTPFCPAKFAACHRRETSSAGCLGSPELPV